MGAGGGGVNGGYEDRAQELKRRILALIPNHPEILEIDSAWGLFKVDGFKCDDLEPSYAQAMFALAMAQGEWMRLQEVEA